MGDIQFNGTPEEWDALVKKNKKKEEPKQDLPGINGETFKVVLDRKYFTKQETLEEAAERYWVKQPYNEDAFIEGAKWQQENSYSEEEVDKLISIIQWYDDNSDVRPDSEIFMWFEQFKKK
jgi:hypothetical protein